MNGKIRVLLVVALVGGMGGLSYAYYRGLVRQRATLQWFRQLELRVAANNQLAKQQERATILAIRRAEHRNRQQVRELPHHLKIMAVAESNTVAPGEVYRAELVMRKVLVIPGAQLYCDGQPVAVGPDGMGHVSFRAPTRPGRASWLAKMRILVNGRDTTFQRRVVYRVARR